MSNRPSVNKVVLAYSGGLDTSVILTWLKEVYKCEVVAFAADIGMGGEMDGIREKALRTGATEVHIEDVQEEFVRDFVFPALRGNAIYEGYYLLGTSIARPIIAKAQIDVARRVGADAVAHGATGKGNDQVRFELAYHTLMPGVTVIAPWREWDLGSRSALMEFARKHNIPIPVTKDKPYSSDRNLLHISYEGGILEDPWMEPDESMFTLSVAPEAAPGKAEYVTVDFEDGTPVAVDGEPLSPAALLIRLNEMGGRHGVGRVDMVENRHIGMKSRGVYETPGGTILHMAHRAVESLTMDREIMHMRDSLVPKFSELIYNGYWFSPEMDWLRKCIDETQKGVTGKARIKLFKGHCSVAGRKAPESCSLYVPDFATFEEETVFDQADSTGFIRVSALRLRINALIKGRKGN